LRRDDSHSNNSSNNSHNKSNRYTPPSERPRPQQPQHQQLQHANLNNNPAASQQIEQTKDDLIFRRVRNNLTLWFPGIQKLLT
jgi:hypothetical protein